MLFITHLLFLPEVSSVFEHSCCYSISRRSTSFHTYRSLLPLSSSRLASAPSSSSLSISLAPAVKHLLGSHATIHLRMYYYRLWGVNALRSRRPRAQLPFFKKVKQMFASRRGSPSSTPAAPLHRLPINMLLSVIHYITHFIAFATLECRRWVVRGISILVTLIFYSSWDVFNSCFICERYIDGRSRLSCIMVEKLKYYEDISLFYNSMSWFKRTPFRCSGQCFDTKNLLHDLHVELFEPWGLFVDQVGYQC